MQVVILAAGQGTRLRPLTHDRPKSMLNAAGEPIIAHLLRSLCALQVPSVTMVVGHGHNVLQAFVGDGARFGLKVEYVQQDHQSGPGHALHHARGALHESLVLVLPADSWYAPELLARLLKRDSPVLVEVTDHRSARHGVPLVRHGQVVDLVEQTEAPDARQACGGAYVLPTRLVARIESAAWRLRDAIRQDLKESGSWGIERARPGEYIDVIEVEDLLALHNALMPHVNVAMDGVIEPGAHVTGNVHIGRGSVIKAGSIVLGPAHIGDHCEVGPAAVLLPGTSIRNQVTIGPFAVLAECTVGSNVAIGSHVRVRRAVIDNGVQIGSGACLEGGSGLVVGADAQIGRDVRVSRGGHVGRNARVADGREVTNVPDGGMAV